MPLAGYEDMTEYMFGPGSESYRALSGQLEGDMSVPPFQPVLANPVDLGSPYIPGGDSGPGLVGGLTQGLNLYNAGNQAGLFGGGEAAASESAGTPWSGTLDSYFAQKGAGGAAGAETAAASTSGAAGGEAAGSASAASAGGGAALAGPVGIAALIRADQLANWDEGGKEEVGGDAALVGAGGISQALGFGSGSGLGVDIGLDSPIAGMLPFDSFTQGLPIEGLSEGIGTQLRGLMTKKGYGTGATLQRWGLPIS